MEDEIKRLADKLAKANGTIRYGTLRNFTISMVQRNTGTGKGSGGGGNGGGSTPDNAGEVRQSGLVADSTFAGGRKFTKRELVRTKTASLSNNLKQSSTSVPLLDHVNLMSTEGSNDEGDWIYQQIEPIVMDSIDKAIADFWKQL
jgi:hypothetical protein